MKKPLEDDSTEGDQPEDPPEYKFIDPAYTPTPIDTTIGEAPPPPVYTDPGFTQTSQLRTPAASSAATPQAQNTFLKGEPDPNGSSITPVATTNSSGGGGSIQDIIDEYQKDFGRAPSSSELQSEEDNLTKYGWDTGPNGGVKATIDARANNKPASGGSSSSGSSSGSSSSGGDGTQYGQYTSPGAVQTNGVAADDPFGTLIGDKLSELIANNGHTDSDSVALQREKATEDMNASRQTQLNDAQGALADRNLLSVPGIPQGSELGAMGRIEQNIAPAYAQANRDITIADDKQANDTLLSVLNMGNERQGMLGQIALQTLSQNTQWNEFLATYGLQRDQVMYELQNGQISDLEGLMQLFEQYAQTSAGGHV